MTTIREDFNAAIESYPNNDMGARKRAKTIDFDFAWYMWQEAYKQYDKRIRGRPPKLVNKDQKTVDRYELLCKMMRLKKSPTTEAVRMVIFDGVSVAKAAEANGIKVRGVYTAVNRMKEAFSMAKIVAEQKINW